jgi:penicillin-binding protein 1A
MDAKRRLDRVRLREFSGRAVKALERLRPVVAEKFGTARQKFSTAWVRPRFRAAVLGGTLLVAPWLQLAHYVYVDREGMPDIEPFVRFELPTIGEVYDAEGRLLLELAREYRHVVSYEQIPPVLRQAVLAAEDKRFFSHSGVDYRALPRVLAKTVRHSLGALRRGEGIRLVLAQGGSTITQQLARGYFLEDLTSREHGPELLSKRLPSRLAALVIGVPATNKLVRKLEEVRVSLYLEEEMRRRCGSKERAKREIFARYASFIYQGNGRYGFAASSDYYFRKPLASYSAADAPTAALLAGIAKSPRDYAPAPQNRRALRRRNAILALMARNGAFPPSLLRRFQAQPLEAAAQSSTPTHAAAVDSVFDELRRHGVGRFGVEDLALGRISVETSIDARLQQVATEAVESGLLRFEKRRPRARGLIQASVVVLRNADAAVLAEVGGRQIYKDRRSRYSDYNRATQSLRQPGSAMKPLVYLAAFREGFDLDAVVLDEPVGIDPGDGAPVKWISNHDDQFKGAITLRTALAESRNAAAVRVAATIGIHRVLWIAQELGIRTPLQPFIGTALGASEVRLLELANAYRAFASEIAAEPYVVRRVSDASGAVLYEARASGRAVSAHEIGLIQEGLRGVVRLPEGTAHALASRSFGIPVMGKTGTSNDYRDALFIGSTYGPTGITVGVRVGYDDNRALGARETGGRSALPIFREIVQRAYKERLVPPAAEFPREIEAHIDEHLRARSLAGWGARPAEWEPRVSPWLLGAPATYDQAAGLPLILHPWGEPVRR